MVLYYLRLTHCFYFIYSFKRFLIFSFLYLLYILFTKGSRMRFFISLFLGTLFIIYSSSICCAQQYSSKQIAAYVRQVPADVEKNIAPLVKYLTKPFDNDYDKAKSIAFWIASHIYYDSFLYNGAENKDTYLRKSYQEQTPAKLLRSRVGICVDYAALFQAMCRKAGITARTVDGYAYPSHLAFSAAVRRNYAHTWNYFYYNGKKIYVDTTFMAGGSLSSDDYPNSAKRRRALYRFKKQNKEKEQTASIYGYYFDFSYKDELSQKKRIHKER